MLRGTPVVGGRKNRSQLFNREVVDASVDWPDDDCPDNDWAIVAGAMVKAGRAIAKPIAPLMNVVVIAVCLIAINLKSSGYSNRAIN